jgi:tetratricopeptide (TPR) repeat protein
MRYFSQRDRTATTVGLLLCAFLLAMPVDSPAAERGPSAQSVLDEAFQVIMPAPKTGDEYALVKIAVRQAKLQSCQTAKDLFRTASNWNERWNSDIDSKISFLEYLVAHQRNANCAEEMHETADRLVALYQQRYQHALEQISGDEVAFTLGFQLERGNLYLLMEDWDSARAIAPTILKSLRSSKWRWRPGGPDFENALIFLARLGHDEQALQVVSEYDKVFESRQDLKDGYNERMWWISRIATLAAVAEGQAKAGHQEAARQTLRRAIDKVRETPVKRLTELYGESARPSLGEGEALQSAGAMGIVWRAARIGETALALEAFKLTSPVANDPTTTWALLVALTKTGQIERARHILKTMQCSSQTIAQGLLEKQDWHGALQEEQAYQQTSSRERECDVSEVGTWRDYWSGLGKARTFIEGEARALAWARKQNVYIKVDALLGVVDALIDLGEKGAGGRNDQEVR